MTFHWCIAVAYFTSLGLLGAWGIHRMVLLLWLRLRDPTKAISPHPNQTVLVQLPLFNEPTVAARLIDAVAALQWPNLRIQVLDDSTDQTPTIVATRIQHWAQQGVDIAHIRRPQRVGYKAGALAHGLRLDDAEFIAIFDADFVPKPDFLLSLMPAFSRPEVGMVQARWGHSNRDQNWLTRIQALMLDGHFVIEHTARYRAGRFFNFNGTAGVWRRDAIETSGGWSHDTVTEDLDLSYRAQMKGWQFVYLDQVVVPSEVPSSLRAFLTQQHRWAKGTAQTARKLVRPILRSALPFKVRIEAINHLTLVLAYPTVFLLAVLLPLSIPARESVLGSEWMWLDVAAVCSTTASVVWFYAAALRRAGASLRERWWEIPTAMSVGVGCSASLSIAVFEGLVSNDATFVRTPKQGDAPSLLHGSQTHPLRWALTGAMAAYYTAAILWAMGTQHWSSLPFMLLFGAGFAACFIRLTAEGLRTGEAVEMDVPQPAK